MSITAVCPGSFDPPTEGHVSIINRTVRLFDKVIVAVAVNSSKKTLLTTEERVSLLKELLKKRTTVEVDSFEDRLLVEYVRSKKAQVIVRGLRTIQDYEYEFQMALANKQLASEIETIFIMTEPPYSHISSSLTKEILKLGGPGKGIVPPLVEKKIREKLQK